MLKVVMLHHVFHDPSPGSAPIIGTWFTLKVAVKKQQKKQKNNQVETQRNSFLLEFNCTSAVRKIQELHGAVQLI